VHRARCRRLSTRRRLSAAQRRCARLTRQQTRRRCVRPSTARCGPIAPHRTPGGCVTARGVLGLVG
jgi:hypothetical protein